jgi:hypothetical protein
MDAPDAHHRINNLFCISCHEESLSHFHYPHPAFAKHTVSAPKSEIGLLVVMYTFLLGFGGGARD